MQDRELNRTVDNFATFGKKMTREYVASETRKPSPRPAPTPPAAPSAKQAKYTFDHANDFLRRYEEPLKDTTKGPIAAKTRVKQRPLARKMADTAPVSALPKAKPFQGRTPQAAKLQRSPSSVTGTFRGKRG